MDKKKIIIFYKDGKSIEELKNNLKNWLIKNKIYSKNESIKDLLVSELCDIHFLDLSYRNLNKFLERYPNFDFGIDVNTDEIYKEYPSKIPNDIDCLRWDKVVEDYIKGLYGTTTVYEIVDNEVVEKQVSTLDLKNNNNKYFLSKEEIIESLTQKISFNDKQIKYYSEMIDKYNEEISDKLALLRELKK